MSYSFDIHHIIPVEAYKSIKNDLGHDWKEFFGRDFVQDYGNRIALFKDQKMVDHFNQMRLLNPDVWGDLPVGAVSHTGNHHGYNEAVKIKIQDIVNSDLTNEQKKLAFIDLQQVLRNELINPTFNLYGKQNEIERVIESKTISFGEIKSAIGERYNQSLKYLKDYEAQKDRLNPNDKFNIDSSSSSAANTIYRAEFYKDVAKTILENKDKILIDDLMTPEVKTAYLDMVQRVYDGEYGKRSVSILGDMIIYHAGTFSGVGAEDVKKFQVLLDTAHEEHKQKIIRDIDEKRANLNEVEGKKTQINKQISKLQVDLRTADKATINNIHKQIEVLKTEESILVQKEESHKVEIQRATSELALTEKHGQTFKGQGGFVNTAVLQEGLTRTYNEIVDSAKAGAAKYFNYDNDKLSVNSLGASKFASLLKDNFIGGKFGVFSTTADFLNGSFNSIVKGIETGDWNDFANQAKEYGVELVVATVVMAAAAEGVLAVTSLLGVPVVGTTLVSLVMLAGAGVAGYAFGSLLYKINKYAKEAGFVERNLSDLYSDEAFDKWADSITPDFLKDFFGINRDGISYFYDPLTLDLNKDGVINTVAHNKDNGALFDNDADGSRMATGWVAPSDGLLVLDRNHDGLINDGTEVFGDSTVLRSGEKATHGFDALADLDSNWDGRIDANDEQFDDLKVWRDLNQDGVSQANELFTLSELNIKALHLDYQDTNEVLEGDNILAQVGVYETNDGTLHKMGDVNFSFNSIYSQFDDVIEVREDLWELPNLKGYGGVRDLQEAMTLSLDLDNSVKNFLAASSFEVQDAEFLNVLKNWAETSDNYTSYEGSLYQIELVNGVEKHTEYYSEEFDVIKWKIGIIDAFYGINADALYFMTENEIPTIIETINQNFGAISNQIHKALFPESDIAQDLYASIGHEWINNDVLGLNLNFESTVDYIETQFSGNLEVAIKALVLLIEYKNRYSDIVTESNLFESKALLFKYLEEVDESVMNWVTSYSSLPLVAGGNNTDDFISATYVGMGASKKEILLGGSGDDYIVSESGFNTLVGGSGNDTIYGSSHKQDIYIFQKGHGHDLVRDSGFDMDTSTLEFLDATYNKVYFVGANSKDAVISRINDDLLINTYGEEDSVRFENYFLAGSNNKAYSFIFKDKVMDLRDIEAMQIKFTSTEPGIFMQGWRGLEYIMGTEGDDVVSSGGGDVVEGRGGNDQLYGDIYAKDTYVFRKNHGQDLVQDGEYGADSRNTIKFYGADFEDAKFEMDGSDLVIKAFGSDDSVRLSNFFFSTASQGFDFFFNDKLVSQAELEALEIVVPATSGDDYYVAGWAGNHKFEGGEGNDYFEGHRGDDYIDGGAGNDTLVGSSGNNTIIGGAGDDTIDTYWGVNTLIYNVLAGAENDAVGGNGHDQIFNFNVDTDTLDLTGLLMGGEPIESYLSIVQEGSKVSINLDRDGSAEQYKPTEFLTLWNLNTDKLEDILLNNVIV